MSQANLSYSLLPLLLCSLLSACGGGGGGGSSQSSSSTTTPSSSLVAITNDNAATTGGAAVDSANSISSAGSMGSSFVTGASINEAKRIGLVALIRQQLNTIEQSPSLVTGAQVSKNCTVSGSWTSELKDLDGDGRLSIGETVNLSLNNCVSVTGTAPVSGMMSFSLLEKTSNSSINGKFSVTLSDLTIAGEKGSGDMTMTLLGSDLQHLTAVLQGKSLTTTTIATGKTEVLNDYSMTMVLNDVTGAYSLNMAGKVSSSTLGGAVSLSTPTTLSGNATNNPDYPTAGVILIAGANSTQARLTAIDNTYVELAIDANGDGTFETKSTRKWADLEAL